MNLVTSHFYATGDSPGWALAPESARSNLRTMAVLLEQVRAAGGGLPMRVTSGYRSAAYNAAVGGSPNSQHLTGSAVDFALPGGTDLHGWASTVFRSIPGSAFGQAIVYPWSDRHVHLSLPNRSSGKTGEVLVEVGVNRYLPWTPGAPFPGFGSQGASGASDREGAARIELLFYLVLAALLAAAL